MDQPDPDPGAADPTGGTAPAADSGRALTPGATAFLGLGISIGLSLAILVGGGVLVDDWLHCAPFGLLAGLALGVFMAVMMVVATVRKYL